MWRLAGDIALAPGRSGAAAEFVALDQGRDSTAPGLRPSISCPWPAWTLSCGWPRSGPQTPWPLVEDALERFDVLRSPRYTWPLLVAGARASAPAAGRRPAAPAEAAALREPAARRGGELPADGLAQQAHQLTFAAETMTARRTG